MALVFFGGGRGLVSSPLVAPVVAAVLARGASVSCGCCVGADALVLSAVLAQGATSRLRVQSAFSALGAGAWSGSAVSVVQACSAAGASVSWLAGGALSVPLRARLFRRSVAGLAGCSAALFFAPGSGSLAVAGQAVRLGVPVWVFCAVAPASPRGCSGSWVAVRLLGFGCWRWRPAL